ncbi:hypothetical protein ACQVPW_25940 [Bacillus cereus]|uniref:hypothetical protein n=1 Tax=Bacillus cereus TaxID=1396 RepID=UPI003D65CE1D
MSYCYEIKDVFKDMDEEKKGIFLTYLSKGLEENVLEKRSSGSYTAKNKEVSFALEGEFMGRDIIELNIKDDKIITLIFNSYWKEGVLDFIEVSSEMPLDDWKEFINEKITNAFAAAFAQKMETFFFRHEFYYIGEKLDGDYFINGWRISPGTPECSYLGAESMLYFDMKIEGINRTHALTKYEIRCNEIMAILSVVLDRGFYKNNSIEYRWGISDGKSNLFLLGYKGEEKYPTEMPKKDKKKLGAYVEPTENGSVSYSFSTMKLPQNIRKLFRAYESLEYDEKAAFINAARMYQLALSLGKNNVTVSSSYRIAALDALSKPLREDFKNKNAIMLLVQKYCPGNEIKIGRLYESIRSAHFHQGVFRESDINGFERNLFLGPQGLFRYESDWLIRDITRTVLVKWLTEKIPND